MSLSCSVGSFTVPAATGNKAITGLGFQPSIVIFFDIHLSADGFSANTANIVQTVLGIALNSSSRGCTYRTDNFSFGGISQTSTQCIHNDNNGTVNFAADFVSMDAGGFTVNFTTANATAYIVNYMAIGGADLTNVGLKSFTSPTATGAQSQTGLGFKPTAMILFGGQGSSLNGTAGIGFVSGSSNMCANSEGSTGGRYERTNQAYVEVAADGTSKRLEATLTSFDSDGFTLNFTTVNATTSTILAFCLKGGQFSVGSILQKTSTGTQATTSPGFKPTGLLISSMENTASTTIQLVSGNVARLLGAASSTTSRGVVTRYEGTNAVSDLDRTKLYSVPNDSATPSALAAADLSSFDATGFTLNYTTADAVARESIYIAFGSVAIFSDELKFPEQIVRTLIPF